VKRRGVFGALLAIAAIRHRTERVIAPDHVIVPLREAPSRAYARTIECNLEEGAPMSRLAGKTAAVTGGASGIGEATVRRFLAEGAAVVFCDRDGERGRRVEAELAKAYQGQALFVEADVGTEAACASFMTKAIARFNGRLDILVNNAGIRKYHKIDEASAESWEEILAVNLKSYAFCAKAAVPVMRKSGGGAIVNVASVRSTVAGGGNLQYDTTKHAVLGLTRALAVDHGGEKIRCNAVGPGPIFTPFHAKRIAAAGQTVEQYNAEAGERTALKRPGTADEVANCILFLASDEAAYVTGALLLVDGGMTAM
jgi:NAD(P)-dependent dehydrogenase (short-subunit alcohol dehydrogenase family)